MQLSPARVVAFGASTLGVGVVASATAAGASVLGANGSGFPADASNKVGMAAAGNIVGGLGVFALRHTQLGGQLPRLAWAAYPVGLVGAVVGWQIGTQLDARAHESAETDAVAHSQSWIDRSRGMFAAAGVSPAALPDVDIRVNRRYFNASYVASTPDHPGPIITVGRSPQNGAMLDDDAIAHEYAHGVVGNLAPHLGKHGEAGAIQESLADTFAAAVDRDDWLIGEDAEPPQGLRSLEDPGRDGQPVRLEKFDKWDDVHASLGIGNHVAYRIGDQLGRDAMARIYVAALDDQRLGERATYVDLAGAVRSAAVHVYGSGSREAQVVDDAWREAGA